jgi:DNA-binding Lrp family transcriptional regulator
MKTAGSRSIIQRTLDTIPTITNEWFELPKAYVEIRTLAGWQGSVVRDLEKKKNSVKDSPIRDYDVIFGDYDLMVIVEHKERMAFHKAIGDISRLGGVESTNSRVVMDKDDVQESLGPSSLKPSKLSGAP